jgi:hypothetical protein
MGHHSTVARPGSTHVLTNDFIYSVEISVKRKWVAEVRTYMIVGVIKYLEISYRPAQKVEFESGILVQTVATKYLFYFLN